MRLLIMTEFRQPITLKNGIRISFSDQTNRYFGDFHRIHIQVEIALPEGFSWPAAVPRKTSLVKTLEKMGVPGAHVEQEKQALIEGYLEAAKNYLEADDFPQRLAAKLQTEKQRPVFLRNS
jgi:hypothetical protein